MGLVLGHALPQYLTLQTNGLAQNIMLHEFQKEIFSKITGEERKHSHYELDHVSSVYTRTSSFVFLLHK